MNNTGFQITLNNLILCRAGFQNQYGVLTCILDSVLSNKDSEQECTLSVVGLNSNTRQSVKWLEKNLEKGDRIGIEVISENFDSPQGVREEDTEAFIIEQKLKYFYKLREELKDYIKE